MSRLLRLLPSRPDRVHRVSLREDQEPTIEANNTVRRYLLPQARAHYDYLNGNFQPLNENRSSAIRLAIRFVAAFCSSARVYISLSVSPICSI